MENRRTIDHTDAILENAAELSFERQELILAVIKGMLFTRRLLSKQSEQNKTVET